VNDKFERTWKEEIVTYFKVLSWHLSGVTEETTKKLSRDTRSTCPVLNWGTPEYETGLVTTRTRS
jgi:hypothetical protein